MDMSNPDLVQAFDKENRPRKPLYFDPDFTGTVSFNNTGIEMDYKTFKDKVYPKVMMGSLRRIIRMMLIIQRIFYLLKRNTDVKCNYIFHYSRNQLGKDLPDNLQLDLSPHHQLNITFIKMSAFK